MAETEIWYPHETRTQVWRLIKAAGERGITRKQLIESTGKSSTSVDWHMTNMARDGYIQRPHGISHTLWMSGPKMPPVDGLVLELALAEVDDCPAGVSSDLLCTAIGCSPYVLQQALQPAEADGRLQRMRMPLAYGGGPGWCRPGLGEALQEMQREHVLLPVREVDIDAIHHKQRGAAFGSSLTDGQLSITSGGVAITLPAEHTHLLMLHLTPHILKLARDE